MSGKTQFWLGSVMLAVAIGLLVGSAVLTRPLYGQATDGGGEGRSFRYALVTGISGNVTKSESLYLLDDANDILYVFEYSSTSHKIEFRNATDIRKFATELIKVRGKREEKKGGIP